jgi:hypothetical protein
MRLLGQIEVAREWSPRLADAGTRIIIVPPQRNVAR